MQTVDIDPTIDKYSKEYRKLVNKRYYLRHREEIRKKASSEDVLEANRVRYNAIKDSEEYKEKRRIQNNKYYGKMKADRALTHMILSQMSVH